MKQPDLWTLQLTCQPIDVEALEEALQNILGERSLALTSINPPRASEASLEALVDGEPDLQSIKDQLPSNIHYQLDAAPVGNLDWIKKVAQDFPPLPIARWTVFGAAHKDKITDPSLALQIDATSAFGTGEHPTTKGCLLLLDRLLDEPNARQWTMLDMGCGSGILAMAFAKACGGSALGVDMDEQSVEIARDNANENGVGSIAHFEVSMGYTLPLITERAPYDLIMANIFADPLCEMAGDLKRHLKPGGHVILSGILNHQADAVINAHQAQGLALSEHLVLGEWSALAFYAPLGAS